MVNNGNAAISGSAAVVLADSKFVQQQQLCVSEKLSRTYVVSASSVVTVIPKGGVAATLVH